MLENMDDLTSCSLSYVASILGGKWKPFIVWYLSMTPDKRARYSELRKSIPYNISHKMFSQHLSELEREGIIERIVVEAKPLHVDYLLTKKGISFANVLYFIRDWGAVYGGFSEETLLRTKGTMGDGVVVYGSLSGDGSRRDVGERIIWEFDPSNFSAGDEEHGGGDRER
ncbi:transcriptional regulator [Rubneribacter badeniensis]|jgi:DNA-binding HxlR family transcriptional regulator|uniref:Transcriptional regulator n=1 Tax=Rubneribacter badeniensis TaxID=2070688 RepID=A0A2K2U681_9ACTN|nr:helix-turn-helix domain-containing protein [Rubneribacter badeniensis]OUO96564.1 HxlR family transcriptional regulator [Gordonibacter sp. An232A]PNV65845.1 transcriptional regulator [Rubneribacter badeniensis]